MALPTTPFKALLPLLLPYVPGCSDYLAEQSLRLAAIDFCERTRIWREMLTVTFDGQNEAVVTPGYAALHEIEVATFDSDATGEVLLHALRFMATTPDERGTDVTGTPRYITQASHNSISLIPYAEGVVSISAILKPLAMPMFGVSGQTTLQAIQNVIPTFIAQQYGQWLAHGAAWRIMSMPQAGFTDPNRAAEHFAHFERGALMNTNASVRGQLKAPVRTRGSYV